MKQCQHNRKQHHHIRGKNGAEQRQYQNDRQTVQAFHKPDIFIDHKEQHERQHEFEHRHHIDLILAVKVLQSVLQLQ